jgi:hypothetical protein
MSETANGARRRWALCCDCGHEATGDDPAETAANAQAHALEVHGLVIPAELLLRSHTGVLRKREEGKR